MQEITLPKNNSGSNNQAVGPVTQNISNNAPRNNNSVLSDDDAQIPYGSNPSSKSNDSTDNIVNLPKVSPQNTTIRDNSDSDLNNASDISQSVADDSKNDIVLKAKNDDGENSRKDLQTKLSDPSVHSQKTDVNDFTDGSNAQISFTNSDDNSIATPTDTPLNDDNFATQNTSNDQDIEEDYPDEDLFGDLAGTNPAITPQNNQQPSPPFNSMNPSTKPRQRTSPPPRQQQYAPPVQNDPWGDPWGMDNYGGGGTGGGSPFPSTPTPQLSPKERVDMIENVYQRVLKRKPDTRDINYYKYSTLGEDEITAQLLDGKEHTQLVENGREYKAVLRRAEDAEIKIKQIDATMADQLQEYRHLTDLLKEKNKIIVELRNQLRNPYNINSPKPPITKPVLQEPVQETSPQPTEEPPVPTTTKDIFFTDHEDLAKKNDLLATQYPQVITDSVEPPENITVQLPEDIASPVDTGYRYQERPNPRYQAEPSNDAYQYPSMGDDRPETAETYEEPKIEIPVDPSNIDKPATITDGNLLNSDHQHAFNQHYQNQNSNIDAYVPSEVQDQTDEIDEQDTASVTKVVNSDESEKISVNTSNNEQSEIPANTMDRDEKIGFFDLSLEEAFKTIQKPNNTNVEISRNNSTQQNPDDYSVPPVYGESADTNKSGNFVFTGTTNEFSSDDDANEKSSSGLFGKLKDIIKP